MKFLEFLLGLDGGFFNSKGEFRLAFNPKWPGQELLDALFKQQGWGITLWNLALGITALLLVVWVYGKEGGRGRVVRTGLAIIRAALLALVIVLLNRPSLTVTQERVEPSVVALMLDASTSMKVRDAGPAGSDMSRMDAVMGLLSANQQKTLRDLSRQHVVKLYSFDINAQPLGTLAKIDKKQQNNQPAAAEPAKIAIATAPASAPATMPGTASASTRPAPTTQLFAGLPDELATALNALQSAAPAGQRTQVLASIRTVFDDLQGQRLAGIVILTDGRDSPAEAVSDLVLQLREYAMRVFPGLRVVAIPVGSDSAPMNWSIVGVKMQTDVFKDDIVNPTISVRGTGLPKGSRTTLRLINHKTGAPMRGIDGQPATIEIVANDDQSQDVELPFKPDELGQIDLDVALDHKDRELDDQDNIRAVPLKVLDAKIAVLYVDGYPRWEYRYLLREMIRDKTVDISAYLFSADAGVTQDGDENMRIQRFPLDIKEMMRYDVVIFGDVDPNQFTDAQLALVNEFVSKKNGGFGMIAGPRWSPARYRGTVIEQLLPVTIDGVSANDGNSLITQGFRPLLTKEGQSSTVFRFFSDKAINERFLTQDIQPVFWYCRGVQPTPGLG